MSLPIPTLIVHLLLLLLEGCHGLAVVLRRIVVLLGRRRLLVVAVARLGSTVSIAGLRGRGTVLSGIVGQYDVQHGPREKE